jgi:hypothetical protein
LGIEGDKFNSKNWENDAIFAIHRKELIDKSVSKNNAIFAIQCIGLQKWHCFCLPASFTPRRGERQFFAIQYIQFPISKKLKIELAPRRGERQICCTRLKKSVYFCSLYLIHRDPNSKNWGRGESQN